MKDYSFTTHMQLAKDELAMEFPNLLTQGDFERKLAFLDAQGSKASGKWVRRDLCVMFDMLGVACADNEEPSYYHNLVESINLPNDMELEEQMIRALMHTFRRYPSPEDYLERIVMRLSDPEDYDPDDTLRLKILKRFIRHTDYLRPAGYGGRLHIRSYVTNKTGQKRPNEQDILTLLDDGVFDVLEDPAVTREQRKPAGKYGLLKLADDLASGRFKTQGGTRRDLYLFAMAYDMTYSMNDKERDGLTDVVKNLFHDYYANNVIRFAQPQYANAGELESDPAGRDINYKNFAEMIYLYCISGEGLPVEKIERASRMIKRASELGAEGPPQAADESYDTVYFRDLGKSSNVFGLDEAEFINYLVQHYDCSPAQMAKAGGALQVSSEQVRATAQFRECVARLEQRLVHNGQDLNDCRRGLWLADPAVLDSHLPSGNEEADALRLILIRLNEFVGGRAVIDAIRNEHVTRTSLLGVFYYSYCAQYVAGKAHYFSFYDIFEDFAYEANEYLRAAGYQLISSRNLLDLLVVFSAYADLYI